MALSRTTTAPTANRGHVERVATSWAMRMKYSSHDGRTRRSVACSPEVSTSGRLKGSIEPVSRVAEARDYERVVVQLRVYGGGVEVHVGVFGGDALDARHGGDGVEAGDPIGPVLLELGQRRREAPAGREHRIEDEYQIFAQVLRQVYVIFDRLGGLLVALQAHEADRRVGEQGQGAVEHPEAGAQHGDEAHGAGYLLHLRLGERGTDARGTGRHGLGGLGDHDERELPQGPAELRGGRLFVAQHGELVARERPVHAVEVLRLKHRAGTPPLAPKPARAGHPSRRGRP